MQWNNKKNHGFSESDTPYLPTDSRENAPTVEAQEKDENSVLSFVKALIKLHRTTPSLWAESEIKIINEGYPFVFERSDGNNKLIIAINPSAEEYSLKISNSLPIINENCDYKDGTLKMQGVSVFIGATQ